jgi:hypothetical protein
MDESCAWEACRISAGRTSYKTDYVQVIPAAHQEDRFDLSYLLEMLEPQAPRSSVTESAAALSSSIPKIYAIFDSEQYVCFMRAYLSFENCKNSWALGAVAKDPDHEGQ